MTAFPFFLPKVLLVVMIPLGIERHMVSCWSFADFCGGVAGPTLGSIQLRCGLWDHVSEQEIEICSSSQHQENAWIYS